MAAEESKGRVFLVLLITAAIVALTALVVVLLTPKGIERSETGDCLAVVGDRYQVKACSDPAAKFWVTRKVSQADACLDVPGTTRTSDGNGTVWCLGENGVDPATTINGIQVGECVQLNEDQSQATKVACGPGSQKVLLVLRDVPNEKIAFRCQDAGITGTSMVFQWGIYPRGKPEPSQPWARVLCLGKPL